MFWKTVFSNFAKLHGCNILKCNFVGCVQMSEKAVLVKQGNPVSRYRGVEPICRHCEKVMLYGTWECKHEKSKDTHEYKNPCTTLEWEVCPLNPENKLKLCLPAYGRATELLRKFSNKDFHGEIVVTLNWQGEIRLTVYSLEQEENGDLKKVTYRVV